MVLAVLQESSRAAQHQLCPFSVWLVAQSKNPNGQHGVLWSSLQPPHQQGMHSELRWIILTKMR